MLYETMHLALKTFDHCDVLNVQQIKYYKNERVILSEKHIDITNKWTEKITGYIKAL